MFWSLHMVKVCAGIVTYNPNIGLLQDNINALINQVDYIFVVDNGSKNTKELELTIGENHKVSLYLNNKNYGIAQALNRLCRIATDQGYSWILTMDQDSLCEESMVLSLTKYISEDYGVIAPRVEFKDGDKLITSTKNGEFSTIDISACITSGSLTSLYAWKTIGGFDEWYFIDRVDNEFCAHLLLAGYKILRVNKAILYQRAGEMKYITMPFGHKLLLPCYNKLRNYYICRNTIYYFRKYRKNINLLHEISAFVYSELIKLVFEPSRIDTFKSFVNGVYDGFRKKMEYVDYTVD